MMHNAQTLYDALNTHQLELTKQIDAVKRYAAMQFPVHQQPEPDSIYRLQNRDGTFLLTDLLAAKAQCLSAMGALKAAEMRPKKGSGW